jgi:DNA-binding PadR family transcriptional regulator
MAKHGSKQVEALLPLKAVEFEVLLALHDTALHGYGMAKAIEARTEGRLRLEPANLYRRIARLVDSGLVEAISRRRAADSADERRRYFRITALGRDVLEAEALRMRDQVEAAAARAIVPRAGRSR